MKFIQAKTPQQSVSPTAARQEAILKNADIRYCEWNPESRSGLNTKLENLGKISYIGLPYSSAARYNWRVAGNFERPKVMGVGETIAEAKINSQSGVQTKKQKQK